MPEYRHGRTGSLNIPTGAAATSPRFEGPRSPPNTSHVPCKFFRQGACQAGTACPFSHDLGSSAETICKYFAKGNCKFGPKCANIHILPDGRRINYGKNGVTFGGASGPLHSRGPAMNPSQTLGPNAMGPEAFGHPSASALTNSLYRSDMAPYGNGTSSVPFDDRQQRSYRGRRPSMDNGIPSIDTPYSRPESAYGSPRDDDPSRLGFGLSPLNGKGLSVLDAPLPASFDSNGISNAARFPSAPWPSSVPNQFGLESPTPSLSNMKESRTSETLKLLHTSAFGMSDNADSTRVGSPPGSQLASGEEFFGKRAMHSSRYAKPRLLSSSVPKTSTALSVDRDWEETFPFGDEVSDNVPENYIPENLQELLTPTEKARRGSMRADGEPVLEGFRSPSSSSPSRWGPLFQRQREEEESLSRSARNAGSAFGHVGSPLRTSTLAQEMMGNAGFGSPTRTAAVGRSSSETMSMLSQQLQKSRLDEGTASSPLLHPSTARSGTSGSGLASGPRDRAMERHVSSGSISSSMTGRFTTPIDEEDPDFVFSMEEDEEAAANRSRKQVPGGQNAVGAWPSYSGVVANNRGASSSVKDARETLPTGR